MSNISQHGYLLLADISGYTFYLAGVELDHAHEILSDLLEIIVSRLRIPMTISKLEGDAIFAYSTEAKFPRGETFLELIDSTYTAFQDRIRSSNRHTTCECRACQGMKTLDLKFIIHHGEYILQTVMDFHELVGSDVNLAHRLMKNHISDATGWHAYALFTKQSLEHLGLEPGSWHEQEEKFEHLGDIQTFSYDLNSRYLKVLESRQVVITAKDAMAVVKQDMPAPMPVVWEWLNDPRKRVRYSQGKELVFKPILVPNGRRGVGATTHCVHGDHVAMKETVLDWHPFDYYTVEQDSGNLGKIVVTYRLEPLADNETRLTLLIKGRILPGFLNPFAVRLMYGKVFYKTAITKLAKLLALPEVISEGTPPNAPSIP